MKRSPAEDSIYAHFTRKYQDFRIETQTCIIAIMGAAVVVVDDDDDIADLLLISLRRADITAIRAHNGQEGVEAVLTEHPRIVLLDWMMPVKDGIQACTEIRAHHDLVQPHIIMLTARTRPEDRFLALQSGVDEMIPKPFRPRAVVTQVQGMISR